MKLDDPVQKYLPDSVRMPTFQGKEITLLHLATHTSALPRDSDGDLYSFLSNCNLQRAPGSQKDYSNLGVGLLGHLIARKAGMDYETLLLERICQPLGMNDTCITLAPELKARCADGHAMPGHRVPDFSPVRHDTNALAPTLRGAGSIRSTANDLLKFVSAYSGLAPSPLSSVMRKALEFHPLESGNKRPLVWESNGTVFEHGGLTEGYQAELAFDAKKRRGVVVLSNCANVGPFVPAVWGGLLEGCSPKPANFVPLHQTAYHNVAGLYKFRGAEDLCTVRHEGNRLSFHVLGKPGQRLRYLSTEIFPTSQEIFCNEFWQVQVRFDFRSGREPRLVLTSLGPRSGLHGEAVRISREIPPVPVSIRADPVIYDRYVGRYRKTFLFGLIRVGPTLTITHKKDELGSHLLANVPRMGTEEFFPMSENHFIVGFNVGDDLRLTFTRNKKGRTTGANVFWNGKKLHGTRISNQPQ